MESTLDLIQKSIAKKLEIDVTTIKPESTLEELGLDSLDTFDLIFEAEDKSVSYTHLTLPTIYSV